MYVSLFINIEIKEDIIFFFHFFFSPTPFPVDGFRTLSGVNNIDRAASGRGVKGFSPILKTGL